MRRIGYYVHHVGSGHVNRARAVAAVVDADVTGLSSLERPDDWRGDWLVLERDDDAATPLDVTAGGHLHWVPKHDPGLRNRMARVSRWIAESRPDDSLLGQRTGLRLPRQSSVPTIRPTPHYGLFGVQPLVAVSEFSGRDPDVAASQRPLNPPQGNPRIHFRRGAVWW